MTANVANSFLFIRLSDWCNHLPSKFYSLWYIGGNVSNRLKFATCKQALRDGTNVFRVSLILCWNDEIILFTIELKSFDSNFKNGGYKSNNSYFVTVASEYYKQIKARGRFTKIQGCYHLCCPVKIRDEVEEVEVLNLWGVWHSLGKFLNPEFRV